MRETVCITCDCDTNYILPTITMIKSLVTNIPTNVKIKIYFPYYKKNEIADKSIFKLKKLLRDNDCFIPIEIEDIFNESYFTKWSSQIMLKYLLLYYIKEDKILVIDSDVIINGDITPFYNTRLLTGKVAVGTKECFEQQENRNKKLGLRDNLTINAGMCLINVKTWKEKLPTLSMFKKEFMKRKDIIFPAAEQNFMNIFFDGLKAYYPTDKYMRIALLYLVADTCYRDKKPVVFHYLSENKPWKYRGMCKYRFKFWKYAIVVYPIRFSLLYLIKRICWLTYHYFNSILRRVGFNIIDK